ncbi:uncharacterized protein LOC111083955, partial [Limulus polyphemus]|uniref:Uncharacterized protein LOC111083955 n=1 Tax=Limulus polyphemus TaxID=6850 RepID=A0ABM1RYG6_LIMPO
MASHSDRFRGRPAFFPAPLKFPGTLQGLQMCMGGLDPSVYLTSQPGDAQFSLQVQRPFSSSQGLEKDSVSPYHTPFTSTATFPVRTMFGQTETYPTLPTHLIPASSPMMSPPGLDRQVSFLNTGAASTFRSLGVPNDRRVNGFRGSAFIPTKCLKPDSSDLSSSQSLQYSRYQSTSTSSFLTPPTSSSTPSLAVGLSSPVRVKEECSTDTPAISPETHDRLTGTPTSESEDQADLKTANGSQPRQ